MNITGIRTAELGEIVSSLVMRGVKFKSYPDPSNENRWCIECTGGF